ncbi:hypothetical protein MUK60_24475 [Streptomyces sp. LRE541]|uniref:hypothetical protein n=1 Tax=Streptomyces sp. LRE541 TaxID=2931983 RepID=UPI00201009BA|nr:hypothetical protein [Streptomyces sp. LRE541]UPZ30653.1 hypothetical protein MUK60_24475 [Streptomyces sp. LRE541]
MTKSTNRRGIRKGYIYGVVAAIFATCLLTAYLLGAFEGRGTIRSDAVCRNIPDRQKAAKIFNSTLPRSSRYHFDETWRRDADWNFKSLCGVDDENDQRLFYLEARMASTAAWKSWAAREIPSRTKGEVRTFEVGTKGVSAANLAAIYVPCYAHEKTSNEPYSLTVLAHSLKPLKASDNEARQTLIDLATDFARQAHKDAKCDLPSKLPG